MNINEYVKLALRTESIRPFDGTDHGRRASRLVHGALGIVTEIGELMAAKTTGDEASTPAGLAIALRNYKEELGDICWYLAVLADEFGFTLKESPEFDPEGTGFGVFIDSLSDHAKRTWFYNLPANVTSIEAAANGVFSCVCHLCSKVTGSDSIEEILETNIRKLQVRYPEKFSDWHAANRDLEAETKALTA